MGKKILILANHFITIYAFRKEVIQCMVEEGNEVYISTPADEQNKYFEDMGCKIIETPMDRRGTNPLNCIIFHQQDFVSLPYMVLQVDQIWHILDLPTNC